MGYSPWRRRVRHDLVTEQHTHTLQSYETKATYETCKNKPLYPLYTTSGPYFSITSFFGFLQARDLNLAEIFGVSQESWVVRMLRTFSLLHRPHPDWKSLTSWLWYLPWPSWVWMKSPASPARAPRAPGAYSPSTVCKCSYLTRAGVVLCLLGLPQAEHTEMSG